MSILLFALMAMCLIIISSVEAQFETGGGGSGPGGIIFAAQEKESSLASLLKALRKK